LNQVVCHSFLSLQEVVSGTIAAVDTCLSHDAEHRTSDAT
jgi:hypothetical protein